MLSMLENGRAVFPGGRVEGEGGEREVVLPRSSSLAKFDLSGSVTSRLAQILEQLTEAGWLTVSMSSGERRDGYGRLTRPAQHAQVEK